MHSFLIENSGIVRTFIHVYAHVGVSGLDLITEVSLHQW